MTKQNGIALIVAVIACLALTLRSPWLETSAYVLTSSHHLQLSNYTYSFTDYIHEYGKVYDTAEEYEMRRVLFEQRLDEVRAHNENPDLSRFWRKGINTLSDRTSAEIAVLHGYDRALGHHLRRRNDGTMKSDGSSFEDVKAVRVEDLPDHLDWREKPGVLTAVKNQGNCGSCWAFAATATMESRWALATGNLMDLSVQDIVSCAPNPHHCGGSGGCDGGTAQIAYEYVKESQGLPSEWTEGYLQFYNNVTAKCPPAKQGPILATVTDYVTLKRNDMPSVMNALQSGPLAVSVDASNWHAYESGVFTGCDPKNVTLNHGVVLVGYGAETLSDGTSLPYWIIRNSWGSELGEKGFYRIAREVNTPPVCGTDYLPHYGIACDGEDAPFEVCGSCGILYDVSYPIMVDAQHIRDL